MNVFGTQMHLITFIFIILETILLFVQTARYVLRPEDKHRGRYTLLLLMLIVYDVTRGLFPDPTLLISVSLQHMISYGAGFLTAAYFPYYFYKEFNLRDLRWHATIGVSLFLLLPYLLFFVVLYAVNDNFVMDARMGIVVPFVYAIILLWSILRAIRNHYKTNRDRHFYIEEITVYSAVSPWLAMGVFVWFQVGQLTEILCTSPGFVVITILFFMKSAKRARQEHQDKQERVNQRFRTTVFEEKSKANNLTKREAEVILHLRQGLSYQDIADRLFISRKTVNSHIQNVYDKVGVRNKYELFNKLFE